MKRLFLFLFLVAQLTAQTSTATKAVTKTISGNALTEDLTVPSGKTLDLSAGTVVFANSQIPVAKINGLTIGTTAGTVAAGDDSRIVGALTSAAAAAAYQPLDADLTSISALTTTTFGRSLLTQADASASRTTLGLGTSATTASTAYATAAQGTKADNAGAVSGLVKSNGTATFSAATAGTDYLTPTGAGAGLTSLPSSTGLYPTLNQNTTGTAANITGIALGVNGGTGVANTGRTITLGGNLTTSGAFATTLTATGTTAVTLPTSGTLATTGNLSQFDATTSAQLAGVLTNETGTGSAVFAASPALTGTPTAPTASAFTNSTQLSTTAYADAADIASKAALIEREGLRFDGTASAVIGGGIPALGTGDWSFTCQYTRTAAAYESIIGGVGSTVLAVRIYDAGLDVLLQNTSQVSFVGTIPTSGILIISKSSGLTSVFINNIQIDTAKSDTQNYSTPETTLGLSFQGATPTYINGALSHAAKWNYGLSANERTALIGRGLVTLPEQRGGSMVNTFTASTADSYTVITGSSGTGATFTRTAGVGRAFYTITGQTLSVGGKLRIKGTISGISGTLYICAQGFTQQSVLSNGPIDIVFTGLQTTDSIFIYTDSSAASVVFSSMLVNKLGTLFEQDSGQRNAGYGVADTSGNNLNLLLPTSGVSIIDPANNGALQWTTTASAFAYGVSQQHIPAGFYIDGLWVKANGTVSLGASPGVPTSIVKTFTPSGSAWTKVLDPGTSSTGFLYATLGTATTASFRVSIAKLP